MKSTEKLLSVAKAEAGYLEKKTGDQLDNKTANAGSGNYTKYARDLYPTLQGQAWCDMFVDWCFVQAFGKVIARQLLGGDFSAYTPTSAQYYKDKGRYYKTPQTGDQIFFQNGTRIYHTGVVKEVTPTTVKTIEGNTGGGSEVIANGGGVFEKEYSLSNTRIDGYGRPDWNIAEQPQYTVGWNHDSNGWWYADTKSSFCKSGWKIINTHKYYFNPDGYAVTDWKEIENKWYYFEPRAGHTLECALYVTDSNGAQSPGVFK